MSIFRVLTPTGRQLRRIEQAIKEENYELAQRQLDVLKEMTTNLAATMFPRKSEIASLEVEIEKQEEITKLRNAVDNYNLEDARNTLRHLKEQNILDKWGKNELEELVNSITEEGMIQYIKKTTVGDFEKRKGLLTKHRELYPDSKKRKPVIEDLIEYNFGRLTECIIEKDGLTDLYEKAKELRRALDEQKEENLILTLPIDKLIEDLNKYITEKFTYREGGEISAGDMVKVIGADDEIKEAINKWYLIDRIKNFPVGSIGKVINEGEDDDSYCYFYYVEFDLPAEFWSATSESTGGGNLARHYWKNDKKNVAVYTASELERVELVNPAERQKVISELDKIKELYAQFYSKPTEPAKKRHNPEITPQDKVLPRSD